MDYRISHLLAIGGIIFFVLSFVVEPEKTLFCLSAAFVTMFGALASAMQDD